MLFYLPIYNQTKENFNKKIEQKCKKQIKEIEKQSGTKVSSILEMNLSNQIEIDMGKSWFENQAKGWIKIGKGKGGFTFIPGKSIPPNPRKPNRYFEQIPPDKCFGGYHVIHFEDCNSYDNFLEKFKKIFMEIVSQEPFKGCDVDYTQLTNLSKFIDWKTLRDTEV